MAGCDCKFVTMAGFAPHPGEIQMCPLHQAAPEMLTDIRDTIALFQRLLNRLVYIPGDDPSGHPHGYSVGQIPEWEIRQKLEWLGAATQEEATVAATVIQWLGSTEGHKFVVGCLAEAGWQVVLYGGLDSKDSGPCTHPLLQSQGVIHEGEWYKCLRCGETFSITPKDLTVKVGRGRPEGGL